MPTFDPAMLDQVRERANLETIVGEVTTLKRSGSDRLRGLCPFHDERSPSFTVQPSKRLYHCLAGETKVLTWDGLRPISELAGGTHRVLTTGSVWVDAPFKSYGVQQLWAITVSRNRVKKTLYATEGHRWLIRGTRGGSDVVREATTAELNPGDPLAYVFARGSAKRFAPSPVGVAAGFTYGDGSGERGIGSVRANFHGAKDQALVPYFPAASVPVDLPQVEKYTTYAEPRRYIGGLPNAWKQQPAMNENAGYLYGWLAGYFAADGCVSKDGQVSLSSASKEDLEYVRTLATRLGIGTFGIKTQMRVGKGKEATELHSVTFINRDLYPAFFVLDTHRQRFEDTSWCKETDSPNDRLARRGWVVEEVCKTDRVEEVFCAEVEGTHAFALEDNILTGNCFGCQKGGDVFSFLMEVHSVGFVDAVELAARHAGVEVTYVEGGVDEGHRRRRSQLLEACKLAAEFYESALESDHPDAAFTRRYLDGRGITRETIEAFGVGFAPASWDACVRYLEANGVDGDVAADAGIAVRSDSGRCYDLLRGRVVFPIRNQSGQPIAFAGRHLEGLAVPGANDRKPPKYINSPETATYDKSRVLYGLDRAHRDIRARGEAVMVEGYLDVLALHQEGIAAAVATCGTAATPHHFAMLARLTDRVVFAFDGDTAGVNAAVKAWGALQQTARDVRLDSALWPLAPGTDPADVMLDLFDDRPADEKFGPFVPVFDWLVDRRLEGVSDPSRQVTIVVELLALLDSPADRAAELRRAGEGSLAWRTGRTSTELMEAAQRAGVPIGQRPDRVSRLQASAAPTNVAHERERVLLCAAMCRPELLPEQWWDLTPDRFTNAKLRAVYEAIEDAGGAGVDVSAVISSAPHEVRSDLSAIVMDDDLAEDLDERTVAGALSQLLAGDVRSQLQQVEREQAALQPDDPRQRELLLAARELRSQLR